MAGQKVGDAYVEISARFDKLDKQMEKMNGRMKKNLKKTESSLSTAFTRLGGVIGGAFALDKIMAFTKQAVELAGVAEGVSSAFDKLNDPKLLDDLRKATRGTISDLQLMKAAVRANNFKVPLSKLATFFEFATKRSAETGESVDYLVNSIVDGIGRNIAEQQVSIRMPYRAFCKHKPFGNKLRFSGHYQISQTCVNRAADHHGKIHYLHSYPFQSLKR